MSNTPLPEPDWLHLKPFGYAPGNYMNRCRWCDKTVTDVDKLARCCRPCAEKLHAHAAAVSAAKDAEIAQLRADNARLQNEVVMPLRERVKVLEDALRDADAAFEAAEVFLPPGCKEEFAFYASWEAARAALGDKVA